MERKFFKSKPKSFNREKSVAYRVIGTPLSVCDLKRLNFGNLQFVKESRGVSSNCYGVQILNIAKSGTTVSVENNISVSDMSDSAFFSTNNSAANKIEQYQKLDRAPLKVRDVNRLNFGNLKRFKQKSDYNKTSSITRKDCDTVSTVEQFKVPNTKSKSARFAPYEVKKSKLPKTEPKDSMDAKGDKTIIIRDNFTFYHRKFYKS